METALTLHLDQRLVERAQAHAARRGTSVSEIVADLLNQLPVEEPASEPSFNEAASSTKRRAKSPVLRYYAECQRRGEEVDYETLKSMLSPEVRRLIGSALPEEGEPTDEEDYKRYLVEKYG